MNRTDQTLAPVAGDAAVYFPKAGSPRRDVLWIAGVALVYFLAARASLSLVFEPEGIAAVWPPSGIFLSALLLSRRSLRPWMAGVLFLTDLVVEMLAGTPLVVSLIYALSLTAEALFSVWLLLRFVRSPFSFQRATDVFAFLVLSVVFSNGLFSLPPAGASALLPGTSFWKSWQLWMTSDAVGNLLVTPLVLSWAALANRNWRGLSRKRVAEAVALNGLLVLSTLILFRVHSDHELFALILPFATMPFLVWAALRFGMQGVTLTLLVLSALIVPLAAQEKIPGFSQIPGTLDDVIIVQLYLALTAITSLFLAATATESRQRYDALRQSEENLAITLQSIGDGVIATDAGGRITQLNTTAERLTGWTRAEATGLLLAEVFQIINSATRQPVTDPVQQVLADGRIMELANGTVLCARDGAEFQIADSAAPIRDSAGRIIGVVLVFSDVTERYRTQGALRESVERFELATRATFNVIWDLDLLTDSLWLNTNFRTVFGRSPGKIGLGLAFWLDCIHPADRERVEARLRTTLEGKGDSWVDDYRFRREDDSYAAVENRAVITRNESGRAVRLLGAVQDISERQWVTVETKLLLEETQRARAALTSILEDQRQTEVALRSSEARYRALFEHAPDGILIIDLQHRHLEVNASICRMLGYARDELITMNAEDIVVPTEAEQIASAFRSTGSKKAYQQEWKLRRQDGSIFDADVIANLMPDGNLMAMIRDITERKQAEQRIRQLNRTYAVLSEINQLIVREREQEIILGDACRITVEQGGLMMAWIGLVDETDGQLRVSAHFGAGPDTLEVLRQLIGKGRPGCAFTAHALATGEHGVCNDIEGDPRAESWREAALDRGYRAMISLPLTVFSERVGTFNLYADQAGFFDADELRLLDELATDIAFSIEFRRREAERQEAGQKLREEQRLYAALSGATPDYIYFKDLEHRFIRISENLARDLGLGDSTEAIGRTIGHFLGETHAQSVHAMEQRILETGEPVVAGEEKVVWPDGRSAWISTSKVALRDDDGKITQLLGISRDITEKKQLQEQFLRAQRMEAIGALSGGIAHDLNNILSPVILAANMLRMERREAREEEMLAMIENAARRGADVIRQLLTFSRGVEGERIPVQLKHLIREMASIATETFPRNLTLMENAARDLLPVLADATQMHQVLMNLCVNARDAMPNGGKLTIAARNVVLPKGRPLPGPQARPGSFVLVTVSDTGEGIPEAIVERIFEPFFTTKELGKGSGLGLSTVLGIVRSHEGFVTVESKPQLGTTFNVYLPAQGEVVVVDPAETAVAARGRGETLLVVDDEFSILSALRLGLERQGYRVLAAKNGTQAIEIFSGHRDLIKLVVTDLMMPVMDGAEMIRQLRARGAQIPVIACSGLHDQTAAEISTEQVIGEFLPKPYDLPTLFEAVRRQLDLARRSPGATAAPPRLPDPSQG